MTRITPLNIPDVLLIEPAKSGDHRGFLSETYNQRALAEAGFARPFVQDNHSFSQRRGTVRGMHFQAPPHAQDKLIRVTRGAALDIAVDLRRSSPTFGQHVAVELSAENWRQLLIPKGFAHGFQTLTEDCEVLYKVSDYYAPASERGVMWNDPDLGVAWAMTGDDVILKPGDTKWPRLDELDSPFD
ncbi:MAG: dTDP-4-dehydrorhamnose 3,5-epimerase [Caulobacteraceae bacterium]